MFVEKSYKLKTWSDWDLQVKEAADQFREELKIAPNGLAATPWTLSQFDFIASISSIRNHSYILDSETKEFIPFSKDEPVEISSFGCPDGEYDIMFYFSEEINDKEFNLFFSDDEDDNADDESETLVPIDSPILIEVF